MNVVSSSRPNLEQLLSVLTMEVVYGRTHLQIAKAIRAADPVVIHTAKTFFGLSHYAHLDAAQMYAAKLHDKTRDAITVRTALDEAERLAGTFPNVSSEQVRTVVAASRAMLKEFEKILAAIEGRRNEYLAHLDAKTISDPTSLNTRAALTIDQLDQLFVETGNILNDISQLHHGTFSVLELLDSQDYENVFNLIAQAKCAQANEYEKEFKEPWPFERPKSCK